MTKRLRTLIFWAHLVMGLSAAVIVLIMSLTGVLLTYQPQIQSWADRRGLDGGRSSAAARPLSPEVLVQRAKMARPDRPTALRWRRAADAPVEVLYGRESTVFMNRYTGAVLGEGSEGTRGFFRSVTNWHRWLALSGDGRSRGRAITGAANLTFLLIVLAGFYLWWPRNPGWYTLRSRLTFRRGLVGKARDFNWHTVIGIWSLVPLVIVIASAVVISYAWAAGLAERIAGGERAGMNATAPAVGNPSAAEAPVTAAAPADARPASSATAGAELLLERARAQMPAWRIVTMDLMPRNGAFAFTLDRGNGGQPHKRARVTLSAATGEVVQWEPFSSGARAQRLRSILRFAHTGEVLGVAGQTIAGAASAGAIVLIWTGIALAFRRLAAWFGRKRRHGHSGRLAGSGAGGRKQAA
jgi:uncharacterized iron-regulated membrane protein